MYNAFPYPTKISPESIAVFLATHTEPGETVLDCFAGAGSVGLAALLCDRPTPAMKAMAADLGVSPKWGPRNAVLYELGVMGALAADTLCQRIEPDAFEAAARAMVAEAQRRLPSLYSTQGPDGTAGELRYAIWSEVLVCPRCKSEIPFWKAAVRRQPARLCATFKCPGCLKLVEVDQCSRATERVFDSHIGRKIERRRRVLVSIYGRTGKRAWVRDATPADEAWLKKPAQSRWPASAPVHELWLGDLHRSGYHQGITHLHHFYTRRNFLAIATLLEIAETFPPSLRNAMRLLVLSYNATHSTLMTRIVAKQGQNDFSVTSSQSGVLYVSALPIEKNVFEGVLRKITAFRGAYALTKGSRSQVVVHNSSSTRMNLADNSIDYAFTDPPFGDYIPYAEINQLNEAWLGQTTDRTEEVIVSHAQGKSIDDYGRMMGSVFAEMHRVLKPDGGATVVFHSADSKVWQALSRAYATAGFTVETTSMLDKSQPSFKQVVSRDAVKGDPLILLRKKRRGAAVAQSIDTSAVLEDFLSRARRMPESERQLQRLYSGFVARCLELHLEVSLGAKEFYILARALIECPA